MENAAQHFADAFKADTPRQVPNLAFASLFDSAGKPEQAEKHFRQAVANDNETGAARAQLAFARWLLWNNQPEEIVHLLNSEYEDSKKEMDRRLMVLWNAGIGNLR